MRLLRFMVRNKDYRVLTPLCLAMLIALPIGVETGGAPSDGWRIFCWMFAPIPLVGVLVGAYIHLQVLEMKAMKRKWREANRSCPYYTPAALEGLLAKLRREPWWED